MRREGWPFENFEPKEFDCPCCGRNNTDLGLVTTLQRLRDEVQREVIVNSGCRCATYNATIPKSSKSSQHIKGRAADIRVDGMTSLQIIDVLKRLYLDHEAYVGYVYAINGRSVHVDVRTPESQTVRRWKR